MDIISSKIRKARKNYVCEYCNTPILKGDSYRCDVLSDYGDIKSFRAHQKCVELAEILHSWYNMYSDEGFDYNLFKDAVTDYATSYSEIPSMEDYIINLLNTWEASSKAT